MGFFEGFIRNLGFGFFRFFGGIWVALPRLFWIASVLKRFRSGCYIKCHVFRPSHLFLQTLLLEVQLLQKPTGLGCRVEAVHVGFAMGAARRLY